MPKAKKTETTTTAVAEVPIEVVTDKTTSKTTSKTTKAKAEKNHYTKEYKIENSRS